MKFSATPLRFAPGKPSWTPPLPTQALLVPMLPGRRWTHQVCDSTRVSPERSSGGGGASPHRSSLTGVSHALGPGFTNGGSPGLMLIPRSGINIRCMGWTPTHRRRTRGGPRRPRASNTLAVAFPAEDVGFQQVELGDREVMLGPSFLVACQPVMFEHFLGHVAHRLAELKGRARERQQ